MNDIVVIIPMHEFGKENIELLNKAIESVPSEVNVLISIKKGTDGRKLKGISDRVGFISESEGDSFAELVNAAVDNIEEKWFTILEFDDTFTSIWEHNIKNYLDFMPSTSVLMCLEDITDFNNGQYVGFGNEAAWASSFSNELGYLDNECLQNYFDFYLTGSLFNTADWREVGGLKHSIKITFWYEWLLRLTNKDKKVFVIPKVLYNHKLGRKGSLTEVYKSSVGNEETQYWFDMAKKEYFYAPSMERDIKTFEDYKASVQEKKEP